MSTPRDLHLVWNDRVRTRPDDTYVVATSGTWTCRDYDAALGATVVSMDSFGVARHDRVLIQLDNSAAAFQAHHALRLLGVVTVPIHPGLSARERRAIVAHSEPDWAILPLRSPRWPEFDDVAVLELLDASVILRRRRAPWPAGAHQQWLRRAGAGWIVYTSGSSGRPKGVVLPRTSFDLCGHGFARLFELTPSDRILLCFPMSHTVGTHAVPATAIACHGSVAVMPRFSMRQFWAWAEALRPTAAILFPSQMTLLARAATAGQGLSSMRLVITHSFHTDFARCFPHVRQATVWGMTETGGVCVGELSGRVRHEPGLLGRPMVDGELRIRDTQGGVAAEGSLGEIEFRSRAQMLGYHRDPELTQATVRDGWICSGDLGWIASGDLYYGGRLKNVIKRSGETILGDEVEGLLTSHPEIVECVVAAVPDPVRTEEVAVMANVTSASLQPGTLATWCRERIASWKVPRFWILQTDPLPRLLNGKIAAAEVAATLAQPQGRSDLEA